jgi:hypothetical protein
MKNDRYTLRGPNKFEPLASSNHKSTIIELSKISSSEKAHDITPTNSVALAIFEGFEHDPDLVVGREKRFTLNIGRTRANVVITVFGEGSSSLSRPKLSDDYATGINEQYGPMAGIINISTNDYLEDGSGVNGSLYVFSKPFIEGDFYHGTYGSEDEARQRELNELLKSLGQTDSVFDGVDSGKLQMGLYTDQETVNLNSFLNLLTIAGSGEVTLYC